MWYDHQQGENKWKTIIKNGAREFRLTSHNMKSPFEMILTRSNRKA